MCLDKSPVGIFEEKGATTFSRALFLADTNKLFANLDFA